MASVRGWVLSVLLLACGKSGEKDEPMPSREKMVQLIEAAQRKGGAFQLACVNRDAGGLRLLDAIPGSDLCGGGRSTWIITLDSDNARTRGRMGDCFYVGPVLRMTLTRTSKHWLLRKTDECDATWRFDDAGNFVKPDDR